MQELTHMNSVEQERSAQQDHAADDDDQIKRPPLRLIDKYVRPKFPFLSTRHTVAMMIFLGFFLSSIMIHTDHPVQAEIYLEITSCVGYLLGSIFGGLLATFFPANKVFGAAMFGSSICTLFMMFSLPTWYIYIVRLTMGLLDGVMLPACYGIWRFWAPAIERTRLCTIPFSATYAGLFTLYIAMTWYDGVACCYISGMIGVIWWILWLWLVFEKPRCHPTIDISELKYIEESTGTSARMVKKAKIPWLDMLRSKPVIAIVVAIFCSSLISFVPLNGLLYFSNVKMIWYILSSLAASIFLLVSGMLSDNLIRSGKRSTTNVRKLFTSIGFGLGGLCFLIAPVGYFRRSEGFIPTFVMLGMTLNCVALAGYNVNVIDIAPRYASLLMGVSSSIAAIPALIRTIVRSQIMDALMVYVRKYTFLLILILCIIGACIGFFGLIIYRSFASGEIQNWAEPSADHKSAKNDDNESVVNELQVDNV